MRTFKRIIGAAVAGAGLVAALSATAAAEPVKEWPSGAVDADGGLNARLAPSKYAPINRGLANGAEVRIDCVTKGTSIGGNTEWYLLGGEGEAQWVAAEYIKLTSGTPKFCGADPSIPVKITKDTYARQGPSTSDKKLRLQQAGGGQEATCYVYTTGAGTKRWVVTLEDGWLPESSVKASKKLPFCEQL